MTTTEVRIRQRAKIIVMGFEKKENSEIAQTLGLERRCVGRWRRRWQQSYDALVAIEMNESHTALRRAIEDVLRDAPRGGAPAKFSASQVAQVVSTACETLAKASVRWKHGRAVNWLTKWSSGRL